MAKIEKVSEELIPSALKLRRELLSIVSDRDESSFEGDFSKLTEDFFRNGDQTTVLAFDGDMAVGCATICFITVMPTADHPSGKRAHIMNVYTNADYRRRGIARQMVSMLLDEARKRGVSYVSLDATEQGKPLYRTLGFCDNTENMGITFH